MMNALKILVISLVIINCSFAQVVIKIDTKSEEKLISPYLYGRNNSLSTNPGQTLNINWLQLRDAGVMFFREGGGNNATKYNWRKKLSSHPDWYNNVYGNDWDSAVRALQNNIPAAQGMWSFQLIGKAAKAVKANFDDWNFNKSQWWEGVNQNLAGGGSLNKTGTKAAIEGNTDLYLENWPADSTVGILNHWFNKTGLALDKTKLQYWNMDNEPEIWFGTHDDLMPKQLPAEEFMQKYFVVAKKARINYPAIKLVGPVTANEWQWYRWGDGNIVAADGKTYPWLEFFIKRISEEQKATGVKLLDVLDIHYYPTSKNAVDVVQYHRVFFDKNYNYPEANGVKTINGGYDNSQTKEYVFARCNEWLDKYLGANHGVKLGLTESGIELTDPNAIAVWYASTIGEFMKNDVEIFTPWSWRIGMWETLHLFSRYNKAISIKGQSSEEEFVSAYPSINTTKDSLTVVLVNRSTTAAKNIVLNFDNFSISEKSAKSFTIQSLPQTETFVSHSQNALLTRTINIQDNSISLSLPALSIISIQLVGKSLTYVPLITAVDEDLEEFKIFPNPSQEYLEVNRLGEIRVFDIKGREIIVHQEGKRLKIDNWDYGVYIIKIVNPKGGFFSKKFVKN